MKKLFASILVLAMMTVFVQNSYAENQMRNKLTRGFKNVATFPLEIPGQICKHVRETPKMTNKIVGSLPALFRGVAIAMARAGSGLWDIASCNLDIPKGGGPLLKPDYAWQKE